MRNSFPIQFPTIHNANFMQITGPRSNPIDSSLDGARYSINDLSAKGQTSHPKLGFVPNGTGGGACIPAGFFGGGGGGGFRVLSALTSEGVGLATGWATGAGGCSEPGETCFSRKLFIRPVTLNFLFQLLAFWALAEIWSWCRARKLFAVEAAL